MKNTKTQNGITLIALIITIIILLILAIVTINAVQGDGIVQYAQNAKVDYDDASEDEQLALQNYLDIIDSNNLNENFEKITVDNYGDSITYSAGNINDWKIFYKDGRYLYIIASDYLTNTNLPNGFEWETDGTYKARIKTTLSTGSETITEQVANRYQLSWWKENKISKTRTARIQADFLNTEIWTGKFGNAEKGIQAVGGPTLEMWVESWNQKGAKEGTNKYARLYVEYDEDGYYISTATNPKANEVYVTSIGENTQGHNDTLYFPYKTSTADGCYGYFLSSCNAEYDGQLMHIDYRGYVRRF